MTYPPYMASGRMDSPATANAMSTVEVNAAIMRNQAVMVTVVR